MDNEGRKPVQTNNLHEDNIRHIAQFLDGDDALALSLAFTGFFPTVPSIFWKTIRKNPKSLSISQCYHLSDVLWKRELKHNMELAKKLTTFDASHCFWLPAQVLLETVSEMPNLKELIIHDTQVSLANLPQIFKSCPKLNKLSFTLAEENLDKFTMSEMGEEDYAWLLKGFKRLTHLKLFTFNLIDHINSTSWPVTFGVLGWCSSLCIDLHIEVGYPPTYYCVDRRRRPTPVEDEPTPVEDEHSWMSSLKSLVYIARGGGSLPRDNFVHHLLKWCASRREPNSFQRLWIEQQSMLSANTLNWNNDDVPLTKSLVLWPNDRADFVHDYVGLRQLEHAGNVPFSSLANKPNIKYIRGYCIDEEGLNEFCAVHPMLEHLHFSTMDDLNEDEDETFDDIIITVGNWSLPHLKTLVYRCSFPVKEIIDHLIIACPNIHSLHVGNIDVLKTNFSYADVNFLSAIKFSKLKSLSFGGFQLFDGYYLASILQQCPKLQSLHLSGTAQPGEFLLQLGECLPKATHLRDLRVQLFNREEEAVVLDFLEKLRGCSKDLKRLVFYTEETCDFTDPTSAAKLRTFLMSFPLEMKRLVLICLAGSRFNFDDIYVVEEYWEEKILPDRPGFQHFFGLDLPNGNDPAFPRNHCDEIVCPIDWFRSPPHFDDIECQETED